MSAVRPEFGPTLPELLGPRLRALPRAVRGALVLVVAGILLVAAWALWLRDDGTEEVVVRAPVAFNFIYPDGLVRAAPRGGELVRLRSPPGAPPAQFTVSALRLEPYRGDASGTLPRVASRLADEMAGAYDGFAIRGEGRANINQQQGYELVFQATVDGATTYGRRVLLLPEPTAREGIDVLMVAARTPAIPRADAIGKGGPLKVALRSLRFGTERP